LPKIKHLAAPTLANLEIDKFIQSINTVKPSKIRIEADEATYSLYIIIRFQIEKDLFEDKITINELPAVWNQKYQETPV
jgi:carboxypeptidase Taq